MNKKLWIANGKQAIDSRKTQTPLWNYNTWIREKGPNFTLKSTRSTHLDHQKPKLIRKLRIWHLTYSKKVGLKAYPIGSAPDLQATTHAKPDPRGSTLLWSRSTTKQNRSRAHDQTRNEPDKRCQLRRNKGQRSKKSKQQIQRQETERHTNQTKPEKRNPESF